MIIALVVFDADKQLWLAEGRTSWTKDYDEAETFPTGQHIEAFKAGCKALSYNGEGVSGWQVRVMSVHNLSTGM